MYTASQHNVYYYADTNTIKGEKEKDVSKEEWSDRIKVKKNDLIEGGYSKEERIQSYCSFKDK